MRHHLVIVAGFLAAACAPARVPTPEIPAASPLAPLAFFVGEWKASMIDPTTAKKATLSYTVTPALRGAWLEGRGESPELNVSIHDFWGPDPVTGHLLRILFDSTGTVASLSSKGWDGELLQFEGSAGAKGKDVPVRQSIARIGDSEFNALWERNTDGKWKVYSHEKSAPGGSMSSLPGPWNPEQYERFKKERAQPFFDLLETVRKLSEDARVIDLGCGTGELTKALHDTLRPASTTGWDSSAEMLAKAPSATGLTFERRTIESFHEKSSFDVIFSNAALHWVSDHADLFARLRNALKPGGQLAVQMPANFDHPSHELAQALFNEPPYVTARTGPRPPVPVLTPRAYSELLYRMGFTEQAVSLRIYGHVLSETASVVEWTRGTLLTDFERRLPQDVFVSFVDEYRRRLLATLGKHSPYFFSFPRVLIWARTP